MIRLRPSLLESLPFPTLRRGSSYKLNAARCAIQWSRSLLHLHLQATESIWYGAPPDTTGVNTRRWPLFPVDLPVHVVVRNGMESLKVPGRGTELGLGGMALYAGLTLQPGDPIEIEFQAPCHLRVAGIIRNRTAYCFGLEFLSPLPS